MVDSEYVYLTSAFSTLLKERNAQSITDSNPRQTSLTCLLLVNIMSNIALCSQGGIWASVATEGADSHRSPATGRAVGREDLADGRTARILSPPQDHLLRGGQRWVKCLISESLSLMCVSGDLDMLNERMPPRRDASESSSPVDGPRTTNSQVQ